MNNAILDSLSRVCKKPENKVSNKLHGLIRISTVSGTVIELEVQKTVLKRDVRDNKA